ncbi:MAG: B12-binding domain-containing radical SAM protein [bacterium]
MAAKVSLVNTNLMKPAVSPVGLDCVGEALRAEGHSVDLLDLSFSDNPEGDILKYFSSNSPDVVGVTVRNTDDCYCASQDFIIPRIKEMIDLISSHTDAHIVLGGVGFSVAPAQILKYCGTRWGVCGEGESAFPILVARFIEGKDPKDVPGLISRDGGEVRSNAPRFVDLEKLPPLRRDIVDNPRYFREGGMVGVETKRGCDGRCIYCADPVSKGRRIRWRNPEAIVDEMESLLSRGIDHFHTCDSEFNLPLSHAEAVCQEITRRRMGDKIRWYAYASPVPFTRDLASAMRRAGCAGIDFGVDSGSDEMLARLGRDFRTEEIIRTARICREEGIAFMFDLLLGGPGETRATLRETINLMKSIDPSRVGVSLGVRIYDGTPLSEMVRKEGPVSRNENLVGQREENEDLLAPIFYLSRKMGDDPESYVAELIGGDERFFFASRDQVEQNYNYNDNSILVKAIREGYRGAFWDILRRLSQGEPPR